MRVVLAIFGLLILVAPSLAGEPSGSWRGTWSSQSTGHQGAMRARISQRDDGLYQARFSGRFALVIPFAYRVTMTPIESGPYATTLVASKRLGPILGSYQMTATVSASQFIARYQAAGDTGMFRMSRARR